MNELTLFYKPTCPYCLKVLGFMKLNGMDVPLKNISESPEIAQELIDVGGKRQVPCLIIDGKPLYESDDIIEWLKTNWSKQ